MAKTPTSEFNAGLQDVEEKVKQWANLQKKGLEEEKAQYARMFEQHRGLLC
jgi:hypothetical protein